MKIKSPYSKNCKKVSIALALCFCGCTVIAQQNLTASVDNPHKTSPALTVTPAAAYKAGVKRDTVECLFHQLINDKRPLLTWRKGYVVLEDEKIRVGDQNYPKNQASYITGMIKNQFLTTNRKKPVTKKVVQLVLLQ